MLATIALAGPVSRGADHSKNKPNNTHEIADGMAKRGGKRGKLGALLFDKLRLRGGPTQSINIIMCLR